MADPGMIHCLCGYTCGTKAALEKHMKKCSADCKAHGVDPNPPSPSRSPERRLQPATPPPRPPDVRLRLESADLDTPTGARSLASIGTTPQSPATPASTLSFKVRGGAERAQAPPLAEGKRGVRLLLVRHAQSANKCRRAGTKANADPDLSDVGYEQADALGRRLCEEFTGVRGLNQRLFVVSSPMRRCLLTIQPALQMLGLPPEVCLCHGANYEYGCVGNSFHGTPSHEIVREFPEFTPVGFGAQGEWDYRGDSAKENEAECQERAVRVVRWLREQAERLQEADEQEGEGNTTTLLLSTHQTVADLLCQLFLSGHANKWKYGEITHKLQNACVTEVFLYPDGQAALGSQNDSSHLMSLRFRMTFGK